MSRKEELLKELKNIRDRAEEAAKELIFLDCVCDFTEEQLEERVRREKSWLETDLEIIEERRKEI